jgi:hypothetical protein
MLLAAKIVIAITEGLMAGQVGAALFALHHIHGWSLLISLGFCRKTLSVGISDDDKKQPDAENGDEKTQAHNNYLSGYFFILIICQNSNRIALFFSGLVAKNESTRVSI